MRRFSRLAASLVALLLGAAPVAAQTLHYSSITTATGSNCSVTTSCAVLHDLRGVASLGVYIDVGTSGTFNFEAMILEDIWFAVPDDINAATSATADGIYSFTNPGWRRFRVRASAISGSAPVRIERGFSGLRSTATLSGDLTVEDVGITAFSVSGVPLTMFDRTNSNAIATQIVDTNGDPITSFGGGTQYTEDAPAAADPVGTALNLIRLDALAAVTSTDGDNVAARGTSKGELYVKHVDALPATQSGTWNINTVTTLGTLTNPLPAGTNNIGDMDVLSVITGTGATNLGKAEDGVAGNGDTGVAVLTKRTDTAAASAATDGDYQTLNTDASGRLWVNCGTGCQATQYAEDAAAASGDSVTMSGAVRRDSATSSTSADGDVATINVDANGRLWTNIFGVTQAATTYLTVRLSDGSNFLTPGADVTFDAALTPGTTAGPMSMWRGSATAPTAASANDDAVMAWADLNGRPQINTNQWGGFAVLSGGVNGSVGVGGLAAHDAAAAGAPILAGAYASSTIPAAVTAADAVRLWAGLHGQLATMLVDASGNPVSVGGGTQFAEDAASANADIGTLAMARRTATPANTSGADLDYETLQMNAGRLWVDASGVTLTVASHAVTNAGTFAVQVDGTALTSLQLADDVVRLEDDAHTSAHAGNVALGRRIDTLAASSGTSGDYELFNMNSAGALWTTNVPSTNGGLSIFRSIDLDEGTGEVIKASAGQLYAMWVTNTSTGTRWIKIYDAATCTAGTGTPVITIGIPGNSSDDIAGNFGPGGMGVAFATGICIAAVTGVADADTGAPGANDVIVNAFYK